MYTIINLLKSRNIQTYMLTGDNQNVAKYVSDKLGLDGYFANVLPHQKEQKIRQLQNNKNVFVMVGDGIMMHLH
nr:HAD family hydrolase [Mycoplasma miroungirhinis]